MSYLPAVVGVAVIGEHRLRLLFDDGTAGDVDFSSMEWKGVFEPLHDPKYFCEGQSRYGGRHGSLAEWC
jgi:hypothetical protein